MAIVSNLSGLEVTKNSSSSVRITFLTTYSFLVWIFSLSVGWETLDALETPVKLLGFAVAILGVAVYNNIVVCLPYFREANKGMYCRKRIQMM